MIFVGVYFRNRDYINDKLNEPFSVTVLIILGILFLLLYFVFGHYVEKIIDKDGKIRDSVTFADLARHVYFTETGEPLPRERVTKSPFIGDHQGLGIYLLYNGILGDKSVNGGNVLRSRDETTIASQRFRLGRMV